MIRTVRVEPYVDENASLVRFRDYELQWVKFLRLAHFAGEEFRPRLEPRSIQRVRHRTDLKDDGIKPQFFCEIERRDQLFLLLFRRETFSAWEVDVVYGRYPHCAKLASRAWPWLRVLLQG